MLHESAAPMCPSSAQDRADRRHKWIVRGLAEALRDTDMDEPMCEALRFNDPSQRGLFFAATDADTLEIVKALRIAAVRARAGSLARSVARRNERLHCTAEDIDDEVAGDAIYFMNNGRMP